MVKARDEDVNDVARIMTVWVSQYNRNSNADVFRDHMEDIKHTTVYAAVHSKMNMAGMDIIIPDALILLFLTLTRGNPGQSLMLLKEILDNIVKRSGHKIRPGYLIAPMDASITWGDRWPFTYIPEIDEKYHKMWLAQKRPREGLNSDNQCDSPQFWREVYES